MANKEYIQELLARGTPPAQCAQLVGCTPGYITQLCADEAFSAEVDKLRNTRMADRVRREERVDKIHDMYLDLEEAVLQDLRRNVGILRAGEKARLLGALAAKKAPTSAAAPSNVVNQTAIGVVQITVPAAALPQFVLDKNMDIIGLETQGKEVELLPMPTQQLKGLRESREKRAQVQTASEITKLFELDSEDDLAA